MPTHPRKSSPPVYGPALPSQVNQPQPPFQTPTSPHSAYRAYVEAVGVTTPYNVNRAQAAIRRIRAVGR